VESEDWDESCEAWSEETIRSKQQGVSSEQLRRYTFIMTTRQALTVCAVLTVLLSLSSLRRAEAVLPLYVSPGVRAAVPRALEQLRAQGLWLVNVQLTGIDRREGQICFRWEHRYSRRTGKDDPELISTCADAT
jgi:hypothetical protein